MEAAVVPRIKAGRMNPPPLPQHEAQLLAEVFSAHPEVPEVRIFGSRAKGTHSARSDVDLALWGNLDALQAEAIAAELDELPLPYRFDVLGFDRIKLQPLRDHIERVGIRLYPAPESP
jgi:predicted nucleotidyltransferase